MRARGRAGQGLTRRRDYFTRTSDRAAALLAFGPRAAVIALAAEAAVAATAAATTATALAVALIAALSAAFAAGITLLAFGPGTAVFAAITATLTTLSA